MVDDTYCAPMDSDEDFVVDRQVLATPALGFAADWCCTSPTATVKGDGLQSSPDSLSELVVAPRCSSGHGSGESPGTPVRGIAPTLLTSGSGSFSAALVAMGGRTRQDMYYGVPPQPELQDLEAQLPPLEARVGLCIVDLAQAWEPSVLSPSASVTHAPSSGNTSGCGQCGGGASSGGTARRWRALRGALKTTCSFVAEPLSSAASAAPPLPANLRALSASSSRDISVAAGVHKGATIAVILPVACEPPVEKQLHACGLRFPPDMLGWHLLEDGSRLALLQVDNAQDFEKDLTNVGGWASHGQAKNLRRAQVRALKLLERYVDDEGQRSQLRISIHSECQDVISRLIPGARLWPLSDVLVNRVIALNIARERFRNVRNLLRLDRGPRFLDLARLHYGEETAFLFAWQSNYLLVLCWFVFFTLPFIIQRTVAGKGYLGSSMLVHSLLTIIFGVAVVGRWKPKVNHLVHRWHTHGDTGARWHTLVSGMLESREMARRFAELEPSPCASPVYEDATHRHSEKSGGKSSVKSDKSSNQVSFELEPMTARRDRLACIEVSAMTACRHALGWERSLGASCKQRLVSIIKAMIVIPIILVEWTIILAFFTCCVWFEIWVIFDWGGCRDFNLKAETADWGCMSADKLRGWLGVVMGALPSICEGVFFELLLVISKFTSQTLISLYDFKTREQRDFAVVLMIFLLEVVGKVGFISVLGLGFVPAWATGDWHNCRNNWDYWMMGDWSLGCLKGQIPYHVRLRLFESCMKGPFLVSGLVGILIKTLLPILLDIWRRHILIATLIPQRTCCRCRNNKVVRCLLAPAEFILRAAMLIFQADCGAVGGLRLLCKWPPLIVDDQPPPKAGGATVDEARATQKLWRLQEVLLEGDRRAHEPFDEYIELLLHFLWTSCFAIVWPLGTVFSLVNQVLELRFDTLKLLVSRRRRFPSTRHMSVAWVPQCARIVCHVSIIVNVSLLLLPYKQLGDQFYTWDWPWMLAAFVGVWVVFLLVHVAARSFVRFLISRCGSCGGIDPGRERRERIHVLAACAAMTLAAPCLTAQKDDDVPKLPDEVSLASVDSLGMRKGSVRHNFAKATSRA